MASNTARQQTSRLLNVSQDHESSPTITESQQDLAIAPYQLAAESAETVIVEDSYKHQDDEYIPRGGAVQSPGRSASQQAFDEDYDATPLKPSQQVKLNRHPFKKVSIAQSRLHRSVTPHHHHTEVKASATALTAGKPAPARTSTTARRPSNLRAVAQLALVEESQQSSTREVSRTIRQTRQRKSEKSGASSFTSKAPNCTPKRGVMSSASQAGSGKLKMPSKLRTSAAAELRAKQQGKSQNAPLDLIDDSKPSANTGRVEAPVNHPPSNDDEDFVPPHGSARNKGKVPARDKAGTTDAEQPQSQLAAGRNKAGTQASPRVKPPLVSSLNKRKSAASNAARKGAAAKSKPRKKPGLAATQTVPKTETQTYLVAEDDGDLDEESMSQASPKKRSRPTRKSPTRKVAKNDRSDSFHDPSEAQIVKQAKPSKAARKANTAKEVRRSSRLAKGDKISKPQLLQSDGDEPTRSRAATGHRVSEAKESRLRGRAFEDAKNHSIREESQDSQPIRKPGRHIMGDRPGGTQDDPEVISATHLSSPYPESQDGHPDEAIQRRTPAARLPSSPRTAHRAAHSLNTAARAHKATVINFGTSGPRNQGALPSTTPASDFASGSGPLRKIPLVEAQKSRADTGPVGLDKTPGSNAKLQAQHKPAQSFFTAIGKPPFRPAPSSNVADSFDAALAGMFPTRAASSKAPAALHEHARPSREVEDKQDANDFLDIERHYQLPDPDFDVSIGAAQEETAAGSVAQDKSANPATESHTIVAHKDDFESPGPSARAKKVRSSEQRFSADMEAKSAQDQDAANNALTKSKFPAKRARPPISDDEMPPPAPRPARNDDAREVRSLPVRRRRVEDLRETAARSRPKRKIATDDVDEQSKKRGKPALDSTRPGLPSDQRQVRREQPGRTSQHVGHASNDASLRRASQCSQTVDANGSPAAPDMQLGETETVLENFSQRTHLSSDDDGASLPNQVREPTPYHHRQDRSISAYDLPTSRQPKKPVEPLSSNAKPVPAPPQAESKAVDRVRVTEKEQRKFFEKFDPESKLHDPFNDLQVLRPPAKQAPRQDSFDIQQSVMRPELKQHSTHAKMSPLMAETSPLKRVQVQLPPQDSITSRTTRARARQLPVSESRKPVAPTYSPTAAGAAHRTWRRDIEQQLAHQREVEAHVAAEEEEDVEKTLFEHQHAVFARQQPLVDQNTATEVSYDGPTLTEWVDPMLDDYDFDDPLKFAKSLEPHQLDLFDELQRCAQRLTMYMVQTENNTERMLEQYHSRNQRMIKRAREKQAEHLQQLRDEVSAKRQEKKRELEEWQRKLRDWSRAVEQQQEQQKAQKMQQTAYNQDLARFIDQLA